MEVRRFPLGSLWTNAYLAWDEAGEAFAVDPGGDPAEMLAFLDERGLRLELILLTHGHADHIEGLEALRGRARRGVAIHAEDAPMLESERSNLSSFLGSGFACSPAELLLRDEEELSVGSMEIRVLHTPGHTPGGVCFRVREGETEVLFSGDTLFAQSVGRTDLPGGDEGALDRSLARLADLPDGMRVFPGHGPETTIGLERRRNPFWRRS
jgi:glyoxylase-like metal-dependent hydrolase (beta-lactamase superfamily II)